MCNIERANKELVGIPFRKYCSYGEIRYDDDSGDRKVFELSRRPGKGKSSPFIPPRSTAAGVLQLAPCQFLTSGPCCQGTGLVFCESEEGSLQLLSPL